MNPTALVVLKTLTSVWSIGLYLSPAPTIFRVHKAKATGAIQLIPFVTMFCNYHMWTLYSLFVGEIFPVFCTTAFAEIMAMVYTGVFARYASDKKRVLKTIGIAAIPMTIISLFALLAWTGAIPQSNAKTGLVLGYFADVTSCLFFASPLIKVRTVIQTRSAACIIAPMCIMGGIGNAIWIAYSSAAGDMFLLVPNAISLCLNGVQIFLSIKYRPNKTTEADLENAKANGPMESASFSLIQSPLAIPFDHNGLANEHDHGHEEITQISSN